MCLFQIGLNQRGGLRPHLNDCLWIAFVSRVFSCELTCSVPSRTASREHARSAPLLEKTFSPNRKSGKKRRKPTVLALTPVLPPRGATPEVFELGGPLDRGLGYECDRARRGNSLGAEQSLVCRYDLYPAAKLKHSSKSRNTSNAPIQAEADKERYAREKAALGM